METVVIVIHLMVVLALVAVVLLQRSEGGALGMGGGGGGGGMMSARGAANALTRTTAILAVAFFATSIALGILAKIDGAPTDILDQVPVSAETGVPTSSEGESTPNAGDGVLGTLKGLAQPEKPAEQPSTGVPISE